MKALVNPDGGARDAPPRSNFFHFNAVFGKNLANRSNRFLPKTQGLAPPPSGKSWIHYWKGPFTLKILVMPENGFNIYS